MAEARLLKQASGGIAEFSGTDTIPAANLPAVSVISPSQITSDQDNYNPTGWTDADIVRLNFDTGGRAITGFASWTNKRQKRLVNTSGNFGYIACEHPDSSVANRAIGVCDHIIEPYGTMILEYDSTSSRIRVIANSFNTANTSSYGRGHFYNVCVGATLGGDWAQVGFGISGGSNDVFAPTSTLPGGWAIYGTASGNIASLYLSRTVNNPTYFGSAHIITSVGVYFNDLSDGTNTFVFSHGLIPTPTSTTLDVNNSVVIKYSHSINSGKFQGICRDNAGTESNVDLGVTVAADTFYILTVCFDKARTEARFYVDGIMCGRVTGNVPNAVAVGDRSLISKTAGASIRDAIIPFKTFATIY